MCYPISLSLHIYIYIYIYMVQIKLPRRYTVAFADGTDPGPADEEEYPARKAMSYSLYEESTRLDRDYAGSTYLNLLVT